VHDLVTEMRPEFTELAPIATITPTAGPNGGMTYTVYIARGFHGSGRRHR
jgi:hypothetical protein